MRRPMIGEGYIVDILRRLGIYGPYSLTRHGPLHDDGWFRSYRAGASIDASGAPLPWITYPAIEFISRRVSPDMSVFEYGSGNGTLWWSTRCRDVLSVEHDAAWVKTLLDRIPENVLLHHIELDYGGEYSRKIGEFECRFDVVVIDGRDRVNCARHCVPALKSSGIIVFDDTERPAYAEGVAILLRSGFRKIEFVGLSPAANTKSETSIFYRPGNVFGI